jgi:hypothetical protein
MNSIMDRVAQLQEIQDNARALFSKKNKDYGDAFANYGVIGVLMRMQDKLSRGISISKSKIELVEDESLKDTLLDLHNYAAMALMLMQEKDEQQDLSLLHGRNKT